KPEVDQISLNPIARDQLAIKTVAVTCSGVCLHGAPSLGDAVKVTVTVVNSGGQRKRVALRWNPGLNQDLQSLADSMLDPGQPLTTSFPGYFYTSTGPFTGEVYLDDGTSSVSVPITVSAAPPPHPQHRQFMLSGSPFEGPSDGGTGG